MSIDPELDEVVYQRAAILSNWDNLQQQLARHFAAYGERLVLVDDQFTDPLVVDPAGLHMATEHNPFEPIDQSSKRRYQVSCKQTLLEVWSDVEAASEEEAINLCDLTEPSSNYVIDADWSAELS